MSLRSLLVPAASLGPNIGYLLIIAGIIFQMTGLVTIGILFFGMAVLFAVLTLPVEIDASRKPLAMLDSTGLATSPEERRGAQSMLTAAALTYLAAAITAITVVPGDL